MKVFYSDSDDILKKELFKRIREDLQKEDGRVLLVVPAQSTLSVEEEALKEVDPRGFFRLNIISGGKLREDILAREGGSGRTVINTIGRGMLLRRITSRLEGSFKAFSGVSRDPRFIDMAGDFLVQMKQNRVSVEQLREKAESAKEGILKRKLFDMQLIAEAYEEAMAGQLEDSEDLLQFTTEKLRSTSMLKDAYVYFYGFYSFTKSETEFLNALDGASRGLCIAIINGEGEEFQACRRTIKMLGAQAEKLPPGEAKKPVLEICRCSNPYSQALTIASRILKAVREDGAAFSDAVVLTPDSAEHSGTVRRVFESLGIPFFMDETRSVMHSSGAEAVSAVLDLADGQYRTRDVIRLLKSGAAGYAPEEVWGFENYIKLYHIKGKRFAEKFKYAAREIEPAVLDEYDNIRARIFGLLDPFVKAMESAQTAEEKALCLESFLEDHLGLDTYLEELSQAQAEEGFDDASELSRQLWDIIREILAQTRQLMGSEKTDTKSFRDLITAALGDVKLGVLPQAAGKVQIGSVKRSIIQKKKMVFLASFCDGLIPSDVSADGILTEGEIKRLSEEGTELSKPSELLLTEEIFSIFRSAGCAEELLWTGMLCSDAEGSELQPSPLLPRLIERFGEPVKTSDIDSAEDDLAYLQSRALAAEKLTGVLREGLSGADVAPVWKAAYNELREDAPQIAAGLLYKGNEAPIGEKLSRELFSKDGELSVSPSRMDVFASCRFRHFIQYGLRTQEEREFGIDASGMGSIYHEALLKLCIELSRAADEGGFAITDPSSTWMTVTAQEVSDMLGRIILEIGSGELGGVMNASAADSFRTERIKSVCTRFALKMIDQVRAGRIDKMYFETEFKRGGTFGPVALDTAKGKVYVEGKIDRVDVMPGHDGSKYVKIIDYKSGRDEFKKELVEKGLKVQLMTYLEGALGEGGDPAGVYYFRINADDAQGSIGDLLADRISDELAAEINSRYLLDGITVEDSLVLNDLDKDLRLKGSSTVIKAEVKNDGSFKGGSVISAEEMEKLRESFRTAMVSMAEDLLSGTITPEQKTVGNIYDSCKYCSLSSVCLKDLL